MAFRKPDRPYGPVVFGPFDRLVREVNYLFINPGPGPQRDPNSPYDRKWLGVGCWRLFFLIDITKHELYTNIVICDDGSVSTTNFTERYENFVIDAVTGEVHLGTKMHVDIDSGISVPWFKAGVI